MTLLPTGTHERGRMTTDQAITDPQGRGRDDTSALRLDSARTRWLLAVAIAGSLAIDQITKELAIHALRSGPVTVGGLRFRLVANRGVLLGFPAPTVIIVVATIGIVVVALRSTRRSGLATALAFGLLAGGALGNLVDRFWQRHLFPPDAVVDWISMGRITFNLADVFLITGAAMLVFLPAPSDPEGDTVEGS